MFYFSTISKAPVADKNDKTVGKLRDIVIKSDTGKKFPPIIGFLVRSSKNGRDIYISSEKVAAWSHDEVVLNASITDAESRVPGDGVLFLGKSVVDRQIVDLEGICVVRVNDLQFGTVQGKMCLLAIDVSTSGLLRRLGVITNGHTWFKPRLLEWNSVQIIGDKLHLQKGRDDLVRLHPADIANIVESLNVKQGGQLLKALDQATAAKVMEEISPHIQKMLVSSLGSERALTIMEKMSVDELVDLIQLLPSREARKIIEKLPVQKDVGKIKKVLEYDEDTAGGMMTTEFVVATPEMSVEDVIGQIRRDSHCHRAIHFVYIVDDKKRYLGVASLRRLIVADQKQKIKEVMKRSRRTPVVNVEQSITEVASIMTKYNLLSVAVVDHTKKLLGIVTVDDVMRCFVPKA